MIFGAGFMQDMVDKVKENLARLPSKQPKNKLGRKFMEGWLPENTHQQNGQKVKIKKLSESELDEVINKIRLELQEERRKWRLILPFIILISILILILILIVFGQLLDWYWSTGKDYLRVR